MRRIKLHGSWGVDKDSIGFNGFDVACYLGDGVSIWPCGEMVDVKEEKPEEWLYCHCKICDTVRENPKHYLYKAQT
jgi:hypothetical protein